MTVIIVTYNSENHIHECLRSLKENTSEASVIVVDNSGKNYGLPFAKVNKSGSYPSGLNGGMSLASYGPVVCCNPDIRFTPNWSKNMIDGLNHFDIVGPRTNFASGPQGQSGKLQCVPFLIGFCFALTKHTYDKIGPFDERFEFEQDDLDYSARARKLGFKLAIVDSYIEHIGHQSMDASSPDKRYLSLYRMLEKYKDENISAYLGASWPKPWLTEVRIRYPEVQTFKSFQTC